MAQPPATAAPPALDMLRQLLSRGSAPLTRQEILARWPEGKPQPRADSLWRSLARGCELGILVRSGAGTKAEAFRYGLAPPQPATLYPAGKEKHAGAGTAALVSEKRSVSFPDQPD